MTRRKAIVLGLGIALASGMACFPGYAFYRAETAAAANSFSMPKVCRIAFSANGGSGSMSSISLPISADARLPANAFSRTDSLFLGWNTEADGSGIALTDRAYPGDLTRTDLTLYAQWESEAGDLLETNWNKNLDTDRDGNGTADRLELKPGDRLSKDPSLKNHSDRDVYGYLLVSVPAISAKTASDSEAKIRDAAAFAASGSWTLVNASVSDSEAVKSAYLYRYNAILQEYGTAASNPYNQQRRADRSTDLFTSFTIRNFTDANELSDSIDVTGLFLDASETIADADRIAEESFISAGLLSGGRP